MTLKANEGCGWPDEDDAAEGGRLMGAEDEVDFAADVEATEDDERGGNEEGGGGGGGGRIPRIGCTNAVKCVDTVDDEAAPRMERQARRQATRMMANLSLPRPRATLSCGSMGS